MAVPPMPGLWNWPNPLPDLEFSGERPLEAPDYAGYKVVANDGEIGHVDSFAIAPDEATSSSTRAAGCSAACR